MGELEVYYDRRAAEYDATSYEAALADPPAAADLALLELFVAELPGERMLDVGCGTGWLTRRLSGSLVVGVDRSAAMLALARERLPGAVLVLADRAALPFLDRSFDLVLTSHVYGHLERDEARAFAAELRRVGGDVVVVEQAATPDRPAAGWESRPLRDGSVHRIYKRYFAAADLAAELGAEPVHGSASFVAARIPAGR